MTSLQVRYFLHLCGTKSISATARQLFVAQPAVSKQIAAGTRHHAVCSNQPRGGADAGR